MSNPSPKQILTEYNLWAEGETGELYHQASHMLYQAYLNAFKLRMPQEKYDIVKGYQESLFDLIDALRDTNSITLKNFLEFADKENPYLADLILMSWCLPRTDDFLSMKTYQNKYREYISKYNKIVTDIVDHYVIKNFCVESLTKTNNIPIHCIDYLWYYVNDAISIEFYFTNSSHQAYLSIKSIDTSHDTEEKTKTQNKKLKTSAAKPKIEIAFGLDMEYLLGLGLGFIDYDKTTSQFSSLIKEIITNKDMINTYSKSFTKENYSRQREILTKNSLKYFKEEMV
jgi:hypothetical protein